MGLSPSALGLPSPRERSEWWGGVGGGGWGHGQRVGDHLKNAFQVLHYVIVPKSEDAIAAAVHVSVTLDITPGLNTFIVLTAIQLDHQSLLMAGKVREVRSNCRLPSKVRTVHWQTA